MAFINKIYVHLLLSVLAQKIHSQVTRIFGRSQNWQPNSYYDERVVGYKFNKDDENMFGKRFPL